MSWKDTIGKSVVALVVLLIVSAVLGAGILALVQFSTPIESGTYKGQKVDYSHQRGIIFQTNDLTTKTNDRSSTTEDWCVPDDSPELIDETRKIEDGSGVRVEYTRPLWIWPGTCQGGLKVITSIEETNVSQ